MIGRAVEPAGSKNWNQNSQGAPVSTPAKNSHKRRKTDRVSEKKPATSILGGKTETALSLSLLGVLVVLIVPLPSVLLDMLLAVNVSVSILLMLVTLNSKHPLDLSVFPSLLLLLTLYRLSLNVATTRSILLNADAGRIVSTFGGFVVGGQLVVGIVIFIILVVIQFIVITKGANRISEVNARFVLDALPGKQMSIDAELNANAITDEEAREKRRFLASETEFYGSMDGASRFVRGDSIAGLIVTAVNLFGGMILGLSKGMSLGDAVHKYSILTIGDGLVSQIPALIVATTAGILVTKASTESKLGDEIGTQLMTARQPMMLGAIVLSGIAFTPGLPRLPFFAIALGLFLFARKPLPEETEEAKPDKDVATGAEPGAEPAEAEPDQLSQFIETDRVVVEVGAGLISLVTIKDDSSLPARIRALRRDLTKRFGIWVPAVRVRDDIQLENNTYRILIGGRLIATDKIFPREFLAIESGNPDKNLRGLETMDPAFGMPAKWIKQTDRGRAEASGHTVVDAASVLVTHLGEILRKYAHELLGREDLQKMLDHLHETAPSLVDELKPDVIRVSTVHQVLQLLLEEGVPITNLQRILETLVHCGVKTKVPEDLADVVRTSIGRDVCFRFQDEAGKVRALLLDPRLEMRLRELTQNGSISMAPADLNRLVEQLNAQWQKHALQGGEIALLTDQSLRRPMRQSLTRAMPEMSVLSYNEIPNELQIEAIGLIRMEDVFPAQTTPTETQARAA